MKPTPLLAARLIHMSMPRFTAACAAAFFCSIVGHSGTTVDAVGVLPDFVDKAALNTLYALHGDQAYISGFVRAAEGSFSGCN